MVGNNVPKHKGIVICKFLRDTVVSAVSYLALGGKHVDRQTFQVLKNLEGLTGSVQQAEVFPSGTEVDTVVADKGSGHILLAFVCCR